MTDEMKPVRCGCGGEAKVMHPSYTHCIVVMCGKCGIKTPYMNTEAEAIEAWNRAMGTEWRLQWKVLGEVKENGYWKLPTLPETGNDPLTWDELKTMEGKPVWVEYLYNGAVYKAGWNLIIMADDSLPEIPCIQLATADGDTKHLEIEWMDMGQWQAYRRER